jgi:hypothetical protein
MNEIMKSAPDKTNVLQAIIRDNKHWPSVPLRGLKSIRIATTTEDVYAM